MREAAEVVQTLERVQHEFENLMVRGLRSVGPQQLAALTRIREELARIGADHLAGRMNTFLEAVQNDTPGAAAALLRAQVSLRLFERVLTLEVVVERLRELAPTLESE
jgi:hypothetical protein